MEARHLPKKRIAASVEPGRSAACEAATGSEAAGRESRRACYRFQPPLCWWQRLAVHGKPPGESTRREAATLRPIR